VAAGEAVAEVADRVTRIEDRATKPEGALVSVPAKQRWGWSVALVIVLAVAAVVGWLLATGDGAEDPAADAAELKFADVIRTDLEEVSEYDGTLGSIDGDPVQSQTSGTITWVPEVGTTVTSGDVIFELDGEPVAMLEGSIPAYRTMTAIEETDAIAAGAGGTVTAVPEEGTLVEQGDVLFEVDGRPVVLLYGTTPFYRPLFDASTNLTGDDVTQLEQALTDLGLNDGVATVDDEFTGATENLVELFEEAYGLDENGRIDAGEIVFLPGPVEIVDVAIGVGQAVAPGTLALTVADLGADGTSGPDVLQLEAALAALGFGADGSMEVDGVFDVTTRAAVRAFQRSVGADDDGIVQLGEVAFRGDPVFVSEQLLDPGSPVTPGSAVLAVASADKFVTLDLPARDQQEVSVGQAVVVELPDGARVAGAVDSIDSIATQGADGAVFEVVITLDDPTAGARLDEAPVDVEIITDSVTQVIAVPVTALLALREGGYAVEILQGDGSTRLVAVDPGFFADGYVELESGDVGPGDRVVVP
jgi:peptidoglycan hydrolase-like protein with peptidoglycan-binding domain/uncharacterized Zn-binding protein involved in type VI secretion